MTKEVRLRTQNMLLQMGALTIPNPAYESSFRMKTQDVRDMLREILGKTGRQIRDDKSNASYDL